MDYDVELLNEKDRGGLTWLSETMIFFFGIFLDVMRKKLEDEKLLNDSHPSSASSRVGAKVIKHCVIECSNDSSLLTDIHEVC